MTQPTITADIRERIIAAAVDLYEQSGRKQPPTVDAVRRLARADMNATSTVMREWRRAQTVQAAPVAVSVPELVSQASGAALVALWQQAQELANESLRAAQAAWEVERAELDGMRQELADAYESQANELEQVQALLETTVQIHAETTQQTTAELASLRGELAQAITLAERSEAKAEEIEHRARDLRIELDHAHQESERLRAELSETRQLAAAQLEAAQADTARINTELVKVQAKAEAQAEQQREARAQAAQDIERIGAQLTAVQAARTQAQQATAEARERAAGLAGQLEAIQQQSAALLARLAPVELERSDKTPE